MSGEPEPVCAAHGAPSLGECERCGVFLCEGCAGQAPNEGMCVACDERAGAIAWETERAERGAWGAWVRTILDVFLHPARTARRLPTDGALRAPIVFACVALALHAVVGGAVRALVGWLQISASLERFGARDSVGRIVTITQVQQMVVLGAIIPSVLVLLGPPLLSGVARAVGARVDVRASARAIAYASGLAVVAIVPVIGLATLFVAPYFLHQWLGARAPLSAARRAGAVALFALLMYGVTGLAVAAYEHSLGSWMTDAILAWLFR